MIYVQENNFYSISLNSLVEVAYCLKQVFHLLYDVGVMPAEEILHFSLEL